MASRTLDDVEELLFDFGIVAGGLFVLYFAATRLEMLVRAVPGTIGDIVDYDIPLVGEGGWIDEQFISPAEFRQGIRNRLRAAWRWVT